MAKHNTFKENEVGKHDQVFEFSGHHTPEQAADYLELLARQVRSGRLVLTAGADTFQLSMGTTVKLDIEAEYKPDKRKCELVWEMSWNVPLQVEPQLSVQVTGEGSPITS